MGGAPSDLFYPDNPNRRNRAQQLANDCQSAQYNYDQARAKVIAALTPVQAKLQPVLKALGCATLEDLDRKVLATATGDALAEWNKVRTIYDTADEVESVIWTAAGIVAIAGITISAIMGVFSFGVGFVAGMTITAEIELVLGAIGLIYDLIDGAIQRDQLRDSINKLFDNRLQMNHCTYQVQALLLMVPLINDWYDALIDAGVVDQDRIIASFMRHKADFDLESEWTFMKTAQTLHQMDQSRGSWTNEDPNWRNVPSDAVTSWIALSKHRASHRMLAEPSLHQSTFSKAAEVAEAPVQTAKIGVVITPVHPAESNNVAFFGKPVDLHLKKVVSENKGIVTVELTTGAEKEYIIEYLSHTPGNGQAKTQAAALFWSALTPEQCLQPDGSFGTDKTAGQLLITSQ